MKPLLLSICLLISLMSGSLYAQIYADFTVSHGGTPLGTFRVELDYVNAPRTCANFIGLATGQKAWLDTTTGKVVTGKKYYDGLKFHRLIHNFMIQGGDPQGNGSGGPGYGFQDEFHSSLRHSGRYQISMANSGTNTNGSQFFILLENASHLDDKHSVFGEVISGKTIIDGFTDAVTFPTGGNDVPDSTIVMESVVISGPSLAGFSINDPTHLLPTVNGVNTAISYDPDADQYTMTWDRKKQIEYFSALSENLTDWLFVGNPYLLSLNDETSWDYTISGVSGNRFFSRVTGIDYSLVPESPADLDANGKMVAIAMGGGEVVTLTFNGSGGGSWAHSGGDSGTLSSVVWTDSAPASGIFLSPTPQAKFIPLGSLQATFDHPVGSESWSSFDLPISFHTATSGWCDGTAIVPQFPPIPSGATTMTESKRVAFTLTP